MVNGSGVLFDIHDLSNIKEASIGVKGGGSVMPTVVLAHLVYLATSNPAL